MPHRGDHPARCGPHPLGINRIKHLLRHLVGQQGLPKGDDEMQDSVFNNLPLLLPVPQAAALLGVSRAAAYRLAASGELPTRRLGGRVYIVTSGLRDLVALHGESA